MNKIINKIINNKLLLLILILLTVSIIIKTTTESFQSFEFLDKNKDDKLDIRDMVGWGRERGLRPTERRSIQKKIKNIIESGEKLKKDPKPFEYWDKNKDDKLDIRDIVGFGRDRSLSGKERRYKRIELKDMIGARKFPAKTKSTKSTKEPKAFDNEKSFEHWDKNSDGKLDIIDIIKFGGQEDKQKKLFNMIINPNLQPKKN